MFRNAKLYVCLMALLLMVGCEYDVRITNPRDGTLIILGDSFTFKADAYFNKVALESRSDTIAWYVDNQLVQLGKVFADFHVVGIQPARAACEDPCRPFDEDQTQ